MRNKKSRASVYGVESRHFELMQKSAQKICIGLVVWFLFQCVISVLQWEQSISPRNGKCKFVMALLLLSLQKRVRKSNFAVTMFGIFC